MISIIMAAFNEGKFIEETIKSILNQSYKNIELIIVNDGSTDNTLEIITHYSMKDSRLKVFSPGKLGKNGAYNYAAAQISGEWFVSFCADDILEPGILEAWIEASKDYNPYEEKIVIASRLVMFATDDKYKHYNGIEIPKNKNAVCKSGTSYMASRLIWEQVYPIPVGFPNEDTWMALFFEFLVDKYIPVLKICTNYRIHANNSLDKNAKYFDFNNKYHKRVMILQPFLDRFRSKLSKAQQKIIESRIAIEELRYNHKFIQIVFFKGVNVREKFRNLMLSNSLLYYVKLKLNRLLLGL